jgi:plastocyanin
MGNMRVSVSKVAAVLLVAWGCAAATAMADDHPVTFPAGAFPNYSYSPPNIEAAVGDTVTFSGDFASHPLVWNTSDFATQPSGTSNTYTFTHPGTFAFHCQIHASMIGSVHVPGNALATPDFSWGPTSPKTGQAVTFTPGAFTDPDGTVVRYEWDLNGDGVFEATGAAPSRTYTSAGNYNVALRYVDDNHETSPATTHPLTVAQGPTTGGGGGGGGGGAGGGGGGTGGGGTPSPSPTPSKPGSPSPGSGGTGGGSTTSPSGGEQGAGTSTPGTTALRVRLGARALTFRSGRARVTVVLNLSGSAKATLRVGKTVLATGSATLRAGTRTVRLTLTKAGTRALRRAHGGVRATLTVVARRSAGAKATTARRTLTVKVQPSNA